MAQIRVVGGENMMEERPVTEGLTLFDTGVKVGLLTWTLQLGQTCQCLLPAHEWFRVGATCSQHAAGA